MCIVSKSFLKFVLSIETIGKNFISWFLENCFTDSIFYSKFVQAYASVVLFDKMFKRCT